jgi:hypothetical protein
VGAFGTVVGAGGGFILTPILLLLYPHERAATLTAISLTAVVLQRRLRLGRLRASASDRLPQRPRLCHRRAARLDRRRARRRQRLPHCF